MFADSNALQVDVRDVLGKRSLALQSTHLGPTAPSVMVAGLMWFDTTAGLLKIRNAANSGWLVISEVATGALFVMRGTLEAITVSKALLLRATRAIDVAKLVLSPSDATSGSDGSNNYGFNLLDHGNGGASLFSAAPSTNGAEATANTAYELVPDQNLSVAAGSVLEVQINVAGSPSGWAAAHIGVEIEAARVT